MIAVTLVLVMVCLIGFGMRIKARYANREVILTFFDVGQGDASLIRLPRGETLLVDAGGGWGQSDIGSRELFFELTRLGILKLDAAMLSHPDQDHGYGFHGILSELSVGELWMGTGQVTGEKPRRLRSDLIELAKKRGVPVRVFNEPSWRAFANGAVRLYPLRGSKKSNNQSLVLLLEFGPCRALFTGDLSFFGEKELLSGLNRSGLDSIDLLKVSHHGSKSSTSDRFLRRLRPQWAVISAGLHNRYGHPHASVLERLRRAGTQILRTDFHGYVELRWSPDGEVRCETAQGNCGIGHCSVISRPVAFSTQ